MSETIVYTHVTLPDCEYCHKAKACSSLSDLEKVVEDLLRYSF